MARFLFVVPPLHGHVNPTVSVGSVLAARGHEVAWCGYRPFLESVVPDPGAVLPLGDEIPAALRDVDERGRGLRGAVALKFFFEAFVVPLAHAMVPGVERAVDLFEPDVLVVDQQTVAGAIVGRRRDLRWATSATTSAELVDPFVGMPGLHRWADDLLIELQQAHGVGDAEADAIRFSPHLVLAFTTPALAGADRSWPEHWAFVGPAIEGRGRDADGSPGPGADRVERSNLEWPWSDRRQSTLLVTLGTVNAEAGRRFFPVVAAALEGTGVRAMVIAPPGAVPDPPSGVVVRSWVPQLAVLPLVDAVVCHGGHNTVAESLAHGLPLVVAPIRDDQPVVAQQVVACGAGVRVRFGRVQPAELRAAILHVLHDGEPRRAARRVQESFTAAGGAAAAGDRLEALAGVSLAVPS